MDEKKSQNNNFENKKKLFRYSKSLIFPYKNNNQEKESLEEPENIININKPKPKNLISKSTRFQNKNKKENHLLIVHKINIKDKKNTFYKEGVNDIFNDENLFLNDIYKNKRVIVGRNKPNKFKANYLSNSLSKKNLGNFNKYRFYKSSTIKNYSLLKKRNDIRNSFRKNNIVDKNFLNAYELKENNQNYSICSESSRYEFRKSFNLYGKRSNIFVPGQDGISDNELKILYQRFLDREKENKKNIIKKMALSIGNKDKEHIKFKNNMIKDINNKLFKKIYRSTIDKEIKSRLHLQEKILNKFHNHNKENQKIINKILKKTSKDNNDILLMNTIDDYRIKMEKIDEDRTINQNNNYNKTIYWLSSLRNYPNKNKNNGDDDKISNNNKTNNNNSNIMNNNSTLPSIYNTRRKTNTSKEDIYDNYLNNYQYSFGNNSNLYCDIDSNITPLYAFILSDNLKSNEKIRNSHIDDYYNINNKNNSNINYKVIKKNLSVPSINNKIYINDKSCIKDINVEGKRLIDYEMEMSKHLEGKKKKLIKINYAEDETDTKTFAKSTLVDTFYYPKAVKNAFQLHYNKDIQCNYLNYKKL